MMKEIQPQGPYRLVGYSYGACIAFEMACTLQKESINNIESLILLDGSVHYMQVLLLYLSLHVGITVVICCRRTARCTAATTTS